MHNTLYDNLQAVLKKDSRFFTEDGELLRNSVYESAMNMDAGLIHLLLSDEVLKERFFQSVDGILVFDKVGFGWVINNRQFLPDSYTRYKNKIGIVDDKEELISSTGKVELVFPYKDCFLEGGQTKEDQKRDEVFYNEILAPEEVDRLLYPKALVHAKKYDKNTVNGKPVDHIEPNDNLIIKGNNLLGLSSLIDRYKGKIKCIYIDPPYFFKHTTATDAFKYNSNFHLSTWLVFMKNRLSIAKKLLAPGGTIWISISEDGMHYLKVMADDIFGMDCFVGTVPRRTRNGKSDVPFNFSQDFDWLLVYTNVDESNKILGREVERKYYETPDFPNRPWRLADLTKQTTAKDRENSFFTMVDPKTGKKYPASEKRTWCITQDTFQHYYDIHYIVFPDDYDFLNITKPYSRKFKDEDDASGKLSSVISDFAIQDFLTAVLKDSKNKDGNSQIDELFSRDEFDYAKPENLIKSILEACTREGDTVLDFFTGSGTTCAVAHKLNRHYIGIEQMDYIESITVERLKKVIGGEKGGVSDAVDWQGGGSFVYCELAKLNQNFIDAIAAAHDDESVEAALDEIKQYGYVDLNVKMKNINSEDPDFQSLSLDQKKKLLIELLDKNLLYINRCDIDDTEFNISDTDKMFTKSFYKEVE